MIAIDQTTVREFRSHFHRARSIVDQLHELGSLDLRISFKDDLLVAAFTTPDEGLALRFALLMRRFLATSSDLNIHSIWAAIKQKHSHLASDETVSQIDRRFEMMARGWLAITLNDKALTAEEIYDTISEGEMFGNEELAAARLREWAATPFIRPIFWNQFFAYTFEAFGIAATLLDLLSSAQASGLEYRHVPGDLRSPKCIYCLGTVGPFNAPEHVIPEALGNYDAVLPPGYVCDRCNNELLAHLDSTLITFEPIAFLRVHFVPYTKGGKYPKANLQNVVIERTGPNHITLTAKDPSGAPSGREELGDGWVSWHQSFRGRPLDAQSLARALYKVALGFVALQQGHSAALHDKYEQARRFIRGEALFPNTLLMATQVLPRPGFRVSYRDLSPGTPFLIEIFGIPFMLNLEPFPRVLEGGPLKELGFVPIDLSGGTSTATHPAEP